MIGQIVVRLLKRAGARTIVAVDGIAPRRERALAGGATHVLDPRSDPVAETVRELTGGRGADIVIEVSGAAPALNEAIRTAGYNGTVVAMSWYGGSFETLSLSGEFHHNRTRIVSSQVGAVNPDLGPLWSVPRRAGIAREYLDLFAADLAGFVTHRLPLSEAQRGYSLLDQGDPDVMQVVIDYGLDGLNRTKDPRHEVLRLHRMAVRRRGAGLRRPHPRRQGRRARRRRVLALDQQGPRRDRGRARRRPACRSSASSPSR